MANVYYGDNLTSTTNGNWNDPNNWYSSLGFQAGCCNVAGTLLGRVPNGTTDTVWFTATSGVSGITTGPSSVTWPNGYPGTINLVYDATSVQSAIGYLAAGVYSGTVNVRGQAGFANGSEGAAIRAGTTFTGTVVRPQGVAGSANFAWISGGTYTPTAPGNAINADGTINWANMPADPGFKSAGGTFTPITPVLSTLRILGAGFPP